MRAVLLGISWCLILAYPFVVYYGLRTLPVNALGLALVVVAGARLLVLRQSDRAALVQDVLALVLLCTGLYAAFSSDPRWFPFYPVMVNCILLAVFSLSLFVGPPTVERLARISEPDLPDYAIAYTRRVTMVWCLFFLLNGLLALYTAVAASLQVWAWYNGLVSYLLMGVLFGGEWLVRRRVRRWHDAHAD